MRFMRNLPRYGTYQGIPAAISSTENCKNGPVEYGSESDRRKIRAAQELE
ncbi:hypothetical protein SCATT_48060 [Streptantibioticus cattleyicolor NRRL 8057 = DSM 46488]|uniref:Uncharacterized protein n=1 Tax=Streptantibioticus cattleyicolor (strain ATCC 35852 / DSM 46488 / JCM 4925 / NBRC 14057 / NRRL 8057) TaxID=1003195 RepID=G8WV93_STREN|nr:hypothetical protein SCATT_48060 [Streptantibioticus cattleyicolor NRRL 8057 = DSM 46488]